MHVSHQVNIQFVIQTANSSGSPIFYDFSPVSMSSGSSKNTILAVLAGASAIALPLCCGPPGGFLRIAMISSFVFLAVMFRLRSWWSSVTVSLNDLLLRGNEDVHHAYLKANVESRRAVHARLQQTICPSIREIGPLRDRSVSNSESAPSSIESRPEPWSLFDGLPVTSATASSSSAPRDARGAWYSANPSSFVVRTKGYSDTGLKLPGGDAFYEMVGIDMVTQGGAKNLGVTHAENIRAKIAVLSEARADGSQWDPACGVPCMIILNFLVPMTGPSLFRPSNSTEPVVSMISYHTISTATLQQLALPQEQWSPALRLLHKFVAKQESKKGDMPLKMIGMCGNLLDLKVPQMLHGYNGKPCLATKSCTFRTAEMPSVLEFEIDTRVWAVICRQAIYSVMDRIPLADLLCGFCIEGNQEEDLPEQLLCCFGARHIDFVAAAKRTQSGPDDIYQGVEAASKAFDFKL